MSFEDATAALEGSLQEDNGATAPTPGAQPVEQAVPAPTTPEGETPAPQVQPDTRARDPLTGRFIEPTPAVAPAVVDTFDGGTFNPDTLAPELQPAWKQLQAAYTQKTQEVAAQRAQLEQFGDLSQIQQAVELHRTLQDPQTLVQFHSELSRALEQQGLTPAQASVAAAQQIEQAQTPPGAQDDLTAQLRAQYPELAPLLEQQAAVQARLDQFESQQSERLQAEQLAYTQMAMAGELQRQEMAIRQSNPAYEQGDIDAVYELSAFFDGNLLEAQQRYEQIGNALLGRYLSSKSAPVGATPALGTDVVSEQPVTPDDLTQALRAAQTHLAEQGITTIG
jgi:hypothetical protein